MLYLQIGDVKLEVFTQIVLLARQLVHRFPGLLARFVARRRYQPVLGHCGHLLLRDLLQKKTRNGRGYRWCSNNSLSFGYVSRP